MHCRALQSTAEYCRVLQSTGDAQIQKATGNIVWRVEQKSTPKATVCTDTHANETAIPIADMHAEPNPQRVT